MKKLVLALSILVWMCGCSTPPTVIVVVTVSPITPINIDQGQTQAFVAGLPGDSSGKGVVWTATGPGCSGSTCGSFTDVTSTSATYVAPASVSSALGITVTATSVAQPTQSATTAPFYVMPPPTITTTSLPIATPNAIYSASLTATGGVQPLKWSLASGSLPAGVSLNSAGTLYGTPTTGGTSNFTLKVTDSSAAPGGGLSTQQTFNLTVVGVLTVPPALLPNGNVGIPYSASLPVSGGLAPLAWSIYTGSLPSGLVMNQTTGSITGTPTIQGTSSFTVKVYDSSPAQQYYFSPTFTITIGPSGPLTIQTTTLLTGTVNTSYQGQLVATGGTAPYSWTVSNGALPAGLTLNSLGAISGTPTVAAGTYSFTVQATDISTPQETATQSLSITLNAAPAACTSTGNNSVLTGQYAFSLRGYENTGFLAVVGSFTADGNGNVIAGEADTNGVLGAQNGSLILSSSSYSVGPDNRGCATLATPFGTFFTRFALGTISAGVASQGRIIEFDDPGAAAYIAAGQILQQNSSAFIIPLTGNYGLRTSGWDPATSARLACVGVVSGSNYKFGFLEQDCNDNGVLSNTTSNLASTGTLVNTYSTADLNGRGTGMILISGIISDITFYWVSSSQLLVINSDPSPIFSGDWLQQAAPLGSKGFNQASFNAPVVAYSSGIGSSGAGGDVSLAVETADGVSSFTSALYQDVAGAWQAPNPSTTTCTYTVVSIGRVSLGSACGATPPLAYLYSQNSARVLGTGSTIELGAFEPQTPGLTTLSMAGTYFVGTSEVAAPGAQAEVGIITLNSLGTLQSTTDTTSALSQSTGNSGLDLLTLNANGTISLASSGATVVGMAISGAKFVLVDNPTLTFPTLLVGQQ